MRTDTTVKGLNCLRPPAREHGFEDLNVPQSLIPAKLRGTLYRVGPGRFADERGAYGHWFDGEGLLTALRFADGRVSFACRVIKPHGVDGSDYAKRGRIGRAPQGFARVLRSFIDPQAFVNVANTALLTGRATSTHSLKPVCPPRSIRTPLRPSARRTLT